MPEEEESEKDREKRSEGVLEQIIAEKFPNPWKETSMQVQEAQRNPLKINKNRSISQHIIVKLTNIRNKEKILKAAQDKRSMTYNGRNISLAVGLSTETWLTRKD